MDEAVSEEIGQVFGWLRHMCRESWKFNDSTPIDRILRLSSWDRYCPRRLRFLESFVILGLDNPGTLAELRQHRLGRLQGLPLERQTVFFTQIGMINYFAEVLRKHSHREEPVYAYSPDFSQETIAGLTHVNIRVVRDLDQVINDRSLVFDLRTEQEQPFDRSYLDSIISAEEHDPPGAIFKRWATIVDPESQNLVPSVLLDYHMIGDLELPSRAGTLREAEKAWLNHFRDDLRRGKQYYLRDRKRKTEKEDKTGVRDQNPLPDKDERRIAELARNLLILVMQNGR